MLLCLVCTALLGQAPATPAAITREMGGSIERARGFIDEPKDDALIARAKAQLKAGGPDLPTQHRVKTALAPVWSVIYRWTTGDDDAAYLAALGEAFRVQHEAEGRYRVTAAQGQAVRRAYAKEIARWTPPEKALVSVPMGGMATAGRPRRRSAGLRDDDIAAMLEGAQVANSVVASARAADAAEARARAAQMNAGIPNSALNPAYGNGPYGPGGYGMTWVRPYYRADGTFVNGYWRRQPGY